jgi:hypothetical protein
VRFVRLEAAGSVDVPFIVEVDEQATRVLGLGAGKGYRVVPGEPLQPGARYALWAKTCSSPIAAQPPSVPDDDPDERGSKMPRGRFAVLDVTATAKAPTTLGALRVSPHALETLQLVDMRGGCAATRTVDAVDVVSEALSSPWAFAIAFSTYVDGERYFASDSLAYSPAYGSSWVGHGRDKLVTICNPPEESPPLITPGKHTVQFRGNIPGSDVTVESDVVEFELVNCDSDGVDGSAPSGSGGIISGSGGSTSSAGTTGSGGSTEVDGRSPATSKEPEGSCSCSLQSRSASGTMGGLLGLLFFGARRRARPRL